MWYPSTIFSLEIQDSHDLINSRQARAIICVSFLRHIASVFYFYFFFCRSFWKAVAFSSSLLVCYPPTYESSCYLSLWMKKKKKKMRACKWEIFHVLTIRSDLPWRLWFFEMRDLGLCFLFIVISFFIFLFLVLCIWYTFLGKALVPTLAHIHDERCEKEGSFRYSNVKGEKKKIRLCVLFIIRDVYRCNKSWKWELFVCHFLYFF